MVRKNRLMIRKRPGYGPFFLPYFLAALLSACASAPPSAVSQRAPALPAAVAWTRRSAEHRAIVLQTFHLAAERLTDLVRGMVPQTWAVILDVDESVLDNSADEEARFNKGIAYTDSAWAVFVKTEMSTAMPGAAEFLARTHALGGRAVIVSSRADSLCNATRSNLRKQRLDVDLVLCKGTFTEDKNPRFRAIQEGTAAPGWPALRVVMWLGDNIQDFPDMTQSVRMLPDSAYHHFGRDYFIMPNPMYGSWEKNKQ